MQFAAIVVGMIAFAFIVGSFAREKMTGIGTATRSSFSEPVAGYSTDNPCVAMAELNSAAAEAQRLEEATVTENDDVN